MVWLAVPNDLLQLSGNHLTNSTPEAYARLGRFTERKTVHLMFRHALLFALVASPLLASAATPPVTWETDLAHTRAEFTVSHMIVSKVWGHVPVRQLTIVNTGNTAMPQHVDALLDVSHEDTDNHDRDADLRSPTYFDVAKYPTMTFHSTSIVPPRSSPTAPMASLSPEI